jgi:hypothetical protein
MMRAEGGEREMKKRKEKRGERRKRKRGERERRGKGGGIELVV